LILGKDNALFLDHDRRRNHVDVGHLAADQASEQCRCQGLGVHAGGDAVIKDFDFLDRLVRHLADKGAEDVGKPDERLQDRRFFGRDRRHVDGVRDGSLDEIVGHLFGHL
jgi:hypothetical protein